MVPIHSKHNVFLNEMMCIQQLLLLLAIVYDVDDFEDIDDVD